MHAKKEDRKEKFCRQQEEGGNKNIVNVGDRAECPECSRMGHIVWVSKDGKSVGIQCPASHSLASHPPSRFGPTENHRRKTSRNMVFITEVDENLGP